MSKNNREINLTVGRRFKPTILNIVDISLLNDSTLPYKILNGWDENNDDKDTTLRDISIILWEMCGQGVMKNLSFEISKKLCLDSSLVHRIIVEIVSEYESLSVEEGEKRLDDIWAEHLLSMKENE